MMKDRTFTMVMAENALDYLLVMLNIYTYSVNYDDFELYP